MSHMTDLLKKWSHQTVYISHATTEWDSNGINISGTSSANTALVQYNTRAVINSQGKSQVSNCQILFSGNTTINIDDVITLPNGSTPVIISIEAPVDFDGNTEYVKVYT